MELALITWLRTKPSYASNPAVSDTVYDGQQNMTTSTVSYIRIKYSDQISAKKDCGNGKKGVSIPK